MGIGMVIAVDKDNAADLMDHLRQCGETPYEIGVVTEEEGIIIRWPPMKKIAVFASGNGSNFQAIIDVVQTGELKADIALLVCDKPGAFAVERANAARIPTFSFNPKEYSSKEAYEKVIMEKLTSYGVEFIVTCRLHETIRSNLAW